MPKPPYRYTTESISPYSAVGDPYSILRVGDDVNRQFLIGLSPGLRLAQVDLSGHSRQAKIAIGYCSLLPALVNLPPRSRIWRPEVLLFLNAGASKPGTFLGGGDFLNAKDADIHELPGGYYVGFDKATLKPVQDPFVQTSITRITGPDTDGVVMSWDTVKTSRIVNERELLGIVINTARGVGIDGHDAQDMLGQAVVSALDASQLP